MTKAVAFQNLLNSVMPSYAVASVPDNAVLPYQTYEYREGSFYDGPISITVNQYSHGGEAEANHHVKVLSEAVGMSGRLLNCEDGAIWIKRGSPFAQSVVNAEDQSIKRRYINLTVEFITPN